MAKPSDKLPLMPFWMLSAPSFRHGPRHRASWRDRLGRGAMLALLFLAPARAQDAAEILLRLDRLEAENRTLNGQVEELRFQLRRLDDQLKRFQSDADLRFRDLESGKPGSRPPQAAPSGQAPAQPGRRSDAFDPTSQPSATGAPRPLGQSGAATPPGAPLPQGTLQPGTLQPGTVQPGTLPPGARPLPGGELGAPIDLNAPRANLPANLEPAPPNDAKSQFDFARALLERGDYERSDAAFREFLRLYPRDRRVADATFWLGESLLRRTRYREAAEQFLTVTTKYSNVARAPEAMLKLGISLRGLEAQEEACGTFNQVLRKYPNASAAIRQAVEREKARGRC